MSVPRVAVLTGISKDFRTISRRLKSGKSMFYLFKALNPCEVCEIWLTFE